MTIGEHVKEHQPETYQQIYLLWVIGPLKQQAKGQLRLQEINPFYKRMMEETPGFSERLPR